MRAAEPATQDRDQDRLDPSGEQEDLEGALDGTGLGQGTVAMSDTAPDTVEGGPTPEGSLSETGRLDLIPLLEAGPYPRIVPLADAGGWAGAIVLASRPVAVVSSRGMPLVLPLRPPPHLPESMQPSMFRTAVPRKEEESKARAFMGRGSKRHSMQQPGRRRSGGARRGLVVTGTNDGKDNDGLDAGGHEDTGGKDRPGIGSEPDLLDAGEVVEPVQTFQEGDSLYPVAGSEASGTAVATSQDPRDVAIASVQGWGQLPIGDLSDAAVIGAVPWPVLAMCRVSSPLLPDGIAVSLAHCRKVVLASPLQRDVVPEADVSDDAGVAADSESHEDGGGWFVAAGSSCLLRRRPTNGTPRFVVPLRRAELIGDPATQPHLLPGVPPGVAMAAAQRVPRRCVPLVAAIFEDESPRESSEAEAEEERVREEAVGEEYKQRDEGAHREALEVPDHTLAQPYVV